MITKFFDAAMTNKALAAKLAALASEHGYDFTAVELLELGAIQSLCDEDVEKVDGGFTPAWQHKPSPRKFPEE